MKLNNLCSKEVRKSYLNLFKYVGVLICLWRSPKGKLQQLLARLHIVSGFRLKMKNLEISLKISDNGKCFWLNLLSRHHGLSLARLGFQDLLSFMRIHLEIQVRLALIFACPPVLPGFFKKKTLNTLPWMHTAVFKPFCCHAIQCISVQDFCILLGELGGWVWCQNRSLGIISVVVYGVLKCISLFSSVNYY